jgi:hypothetical protein
MAGDDSVKRAGAGVPAPRFGSEPASQKRRNQPDAQGQEPPAVVFTRKPAQPRKVIAGGKTQHVAVSQPAEKKGAVSQAKQEYVAPPGYLRLVFQPNEQSWSPSVIDAKGFASLPDDETRSGYLRLVRDPVVLGFAKEVAAFSPDGFVTISLCPSAKIAYFESTPPYAAVLNRQVWVGSDARMRNTTIHEFGHMLQQLLVGWAPDVDYRVSTRALEFDTRDGHTINRVTNEGTAWVEGLAEWVAAAIGGNDDLLGDFRQRRRIYMAINKPKEVDVLHCTEGWVAGALLDFTTDHSGLRPPLFRHVLEVLKIRHPNDASEKHRSFEDYLREHLEQFPEDRQRWNVVLLANSFLRQDVTRFVDLPPAEESAYAQLQRGLLDLASSYDAERVSWALCQLLKKSGTIDMSPASVLAGTKRQIATLQSQSVFVNPEAVGKNLDKMTVAQLQDERAKAAGAARILLSIHGHSLHPEVQDADEYLRIVEAALRQAR